MSHRLRDFDAIDIVAGFMRVPPLAGGRGRWAWFGRVRMGLELDLVILELANVRCQQLEKKKEKKAAPTTNLNASSCVSSFFCFRYFSAGISLSSERVSERSRPKSWQRRRHMKVYDVASTKWAKIVGLLLCFSSAC